MIIGRPKILSVYITKEMFKNFFIIFFGLLILFFAVDFFETTKDAKNIENALKISTEIVLFRIPNLLETILHFIILLAGLFTFYKLSNNSEIVVMRTSGRSIFQITKFPAFIAFLFGIFVITIYNPISSTLNVKSERLRNIYFKNEQGDMLELENGLWLKQKNLESDGGEIIIKATKVYKDRLVFDNIMLLYMDKNNNFLQRINAETIRLTDDNKWISTNNYIIKEGKDLEFIKEITIPTNLTKNFISRTIQHDYESMYNISFLKLRSSIKDLKESGFNTLKFEIRYYYLMTVPFIFAIMVLVSAYFGIVNTRSNKKYISIIKGIAVGFIIFISHNIIFELSNAEKLTVIDGSLLTVLAFIFISIVLLMKKDLLSNFNVNFFKKHS